jgi:hypothetical protein
MLKFTSFKRHELNLVFKIKVFVVSKFWYFNKFYLFRIFQKSGLLQAGRSTRQRVGGGRGEGESESGGWSMRGWEGLVGLASRGIFRVRF